jgi:hypothetical protein
VLKQLIEANVNASLNGQGSIAGIGTALAAGLQATVDNLFDGRVRDLIAMADGRLFVDLLR